MKKFIIIAACIVSAIAFQPAFAGPMSRLMDTVERSMPILERLASPSEMDLKVHCLGNRECIEGMRRDAKSLSKALDLLKDQQVGYNENIKAVKAAEEMLNGVQ